MVRLRMMTFRTPLQPMRAVPASGPHLPGGDIRAGERHVVQAQSPSSRSGRRCVTRGRTAAVIESGPATRAIGALVLAAQAGDEQALAELLAAHLPLLCLLYTSPSPRDGLLS